MSEEWPDIVIDEDDEILDEEILLSGLDLDEAQREAYAKLGAAMKSAGASIGQLACAFKQFSDAMQVIVNDAVLGQSELSS